MPVNKLHILISEACGLEQAQLLRLLPALHVSAEVERCPAERVEAELGEKGADALILPAADFDRASAVSARSFTAVLLLAEKEEWSRIAPACIAEGLLLGTRENLECSLAQLLSECVRLRSFGAQNRNLRRQLNDTRLVSRAKLLLLTQLQMSEEEAHRYIEKTAMDSGQPRREVAARIIRIYEQ